MLIICIVNFERSDKKGLGTHGLVLKCFSYVPILWSPRSTPLMLLLYTCTFSGQSNSLFSHLPFALIFLVTLLIWLPTGIVTIRWKGFLSCHVTTIMSTFDERDIGPVPNSWRRAACGPFCLLGALFDFVEQSHKLKLLLSLEGKKKFRAAIVIVSEDPVALFFQRLHQI